MEHILIVDVGTSSLKGMVYDIAGKLLHRASQEYHSHFFGNHYVEQDALTWKTALVSALKQSGEFVKAGGTDLAAIAVTSQRASVIPVGADGAPLHPAIMWQDKRSRPQCAQLLERLDLGSIYRRTGLRVDPYFSAPKMMWLQQERPEISAKTCKFLGVQDHVVYLLTGSYVTDWTQACRTLLMNINRFSWDDDMLAIAGISPGKLPELCSPGSTVGSLTKWIADATGLRAEIPVVVAGGDQQCAALALNILRPGYAEANTGTGSFVIAYSDKPQFDKDCRTLCSAAAVAGKWIAEAGIFNTGSVHRWFKEQFYPEGEDAYALMDQEAAASPVGANGVIMLSHFEGSAAPYWNPLAKGLFFNLSVGTRRGDLVRAILEGIALEIAHNLSLIEELVGDISTVSVAGGLVASDLFDRIQADAFNKTVIRYDNTEATSLGALISASVGLGVYPNPRESFRKVCAAAPVTFQPNRDNVTKYRVLLARKDALYQALNQQQVYQSFCQPV